MKRSAPLFAFILAAAIMLSACRKPLKNINDYYPVVKTVSATVKQNGNVEVKGEILSEGAAPIEFTGFCMSESSTPEMLDQQVIAEVQGNTFTVEYSGFDPYKRYYFRSWATNDYGYSYGGIIYLDSIQATPVVAPCTLTMNTLNIGGSQPNESVYMVDTPSSTPSGWFFQVSSSNTTTNFTFGSTLTTGVYSTTASTSPGPGEVNVIFYSGFISGGLNTGSPVYVNQLTPGSWEVTICSAPWDYGSSTFQFNTRFTAPL